MSLWQAHVEGARAPAPLPSDLFLVGMGTMELRVDRGDLLPLADQVAAEICRAVTEGGSTENLDSDLSERREEMHPTAQRAASLWVEAPRGHRAHGHLEWSTEWLTN